MQQENLNFLADNVLPKLGLGNNDDLVVALKKKMETGEPVIAQGIKPDKETVLTLNLKMGAEDERYYLNSITSKVSKEGSEPLTHTFQLNNQRGFTVTEMANLMEGRSVYKTQFTKENERVNSWTRLDLTQKNESDNFVTRRSYDNDMDFRLVRELSKMPIPAMNQDDKEALVRSLQRGNVVPLYINNKGTRERVTLEAIPHQGKIQVVNGKGEELNFGKEKKMEVVADEKQKIKLPDGAKMMVVHANGQEGPGANQVKSKIK